MYLFFDAQRDFTTPPLWHQHHDLYGTSPPPPPTTSYLLPMQCLSFHHLKLFIPTLLLHLLQFNCMQKPMDTP
jgi:hypothetical protein